MNRFAAIHIAFCVSLIGCSNGGPDGKTTSNSTTAASQSESLADEVHFPHEAYLSLDPEISIPAVNWAIENNRGDILESVWLRANCPEARRMALRYFLHTETSTPGMFIDEVREISRDAETGLGK